MREQSSRHEVIGAVLTVGVSGFWFGIGATLGAKMVNYTYVTFVEFLTQFPDE